MTEYRVGCSRLERRLQTLGADQAWVYFNNDVVEHASRDAQRLRQMLLANSQ